MGVREGLGSSPAGSVEGLIQEVRELGEGVGPSSQYLDKSIISEGSEQ